jgi:hypothetical protein
MGALREHLSSRVCARQGEGRHGEAHCTLLCLTNTLDVVRWSDAVDTQLGFQQEESQRTALAKDARTLTMDKPLCIGVRDPEPPAALAGSQV